MNVLVTSIKTSISTASADTLTLMGNLVCGLTESDINSVSVSVFKYMLKFMV